MALSHRRTRHAAVYRRLKFGGNDFRNPFSVWSLCAAHGIWMRLRGGIVNAMPHIYVYTSYRYHALIGEQAIPDSANDRQLRSIWKWISDKEAEEEEEKKTPSWSLKVNWQPVKSIHEEKKLPYEKSIISNYNAMKPWKNIELSSIALMIIAASGHNWRPRVLRSAYEDQNKTTTTITTTKNNPIEVQYCLGGSWT